MLHSLRATSTGCAQRKTALAPTATSGTLPRRDSSALVVGAGDIGRHSWRCTDYRRHQRVPILALHLKGPSSSLGYFGPRGAKGSSAPAASVSPSVSPVTFTASDVGLAWPCLEPPFTYHASAEDAQSNAAPSGLSPIWKLLLLSDGSVTRHLQLLSGAPVTVECLSMHNVGWSLEGLPPGTELIPGPRVQRQVLLRCGGAESAAAAASGRHSGSRSGDGSDAKPSSTSGSSPPGSGAIGTDGGPSGNGMGSTGVGRIHDDDKCTSSTRHFRSRNSNGSSPGSSSGGANDTTTSGSSRSSGGTHSHPAHASPVVAPSSPTSSSPGVSFSAASPAASPAASAGEPLVYASSWWNADTVDEYLRDKSKPIWMSLSQGHVELYREVHALFRGGSAQLEELLGCPGPFWGRQYIFWSGGRPLTLIYEVFSPRLAAYLGPDEL